MKVFTVINLVAMESRFFYPGDKLTTGGNRQLRPFAVDKGFAQDADGGLKLL